MAEQEDMLAAYPIALRKAIVLLQQLREHVRTAQHTRGNVTNSRLGNMQPRPPVSNSLPPSTER